MTARSDDAVQRGFAPARGVRAACVFLTRVPVGGFPYSAADWRWAVAHFPLVGAGVGALAACVYWVALELLGAELAAGLALLTGVCVTGALHEDGLADTFDALGGALSRERIFEVLKDSRVGTYGICALLFSFGLRWAALVALGDRAMLGLVAAHCFARIAPIWLLALLPYASPPNKSKSQALSTCSLRQAALALAWGGVLGTVAYLTGGISLIGLACITAVLLTLAVGLARWFVGRAGGVTGDFLGATEQLGEVAVLLVLIGVG